MKDSKPPQRRTKPPLSAKSFTGMNAGNDNPKALSDPLLKNGWVGCFVLIFVGGIGGLLTALLILELVPWLLDVPLVPVWVYVPLAAVGAAPPIIVLAAAYSLFRRFRPIVPVIEPAERKTDGPGAR